MFDDLGPWFWIGAAWLQLLIAYGGYWLYLRGKARKLEDGR